LGIRPRSATTPTNYGDAFALPQSNHFRHEETLMSGFSIRLTHKVMAIGVVGLMGLIAFGGIYQVGSWSQISSRVAAVEGRAISDLNKQISIEMLQARRAEKDFQLRRNESYIKRHSELSAGINRDLEKLKSLARSSGVNAIIEKIDIVQRGFANYVKTFAGLAQAEIKLGLNEKLGLTGSLRAAVHDIESKLKAIDDPRLTSSMLMLRRHEKDFMLRRDAK
jgi:methyl-accepting chemotaxis protein